MPVAVQRMQPLTDETINHVVSMWLEGEQDDVSSTFGHISDWDVLQVTMMDGLFRNRRTFNEDISRWKVSNVTSMREMFQRAQAFNQPLGDWDVSKVTNIQCISCILLQLLIRSPTWTPCFTAHWPLISHWGAGMWHRSQPWTRCS